MPLTQSGIEYVSKNFNDFIKNIGRASGAIADMNGVSTNTSKNLNKLSESLGATTDAMGALSSAGASLGKTLGGVFSNIPKWMAVGGILGGAIGTVTGALAGGVGAAVGGPLGGAIGSIVAGIVAFGIDIGRAIGILYLEITKTIVSFLPKTIAKIVNAGISIGKAIYDFGAKVIAAAKSVLSPIINVVKGLFSAIFGMFGGGGQGGGWRSLGGSIFSAMFKFEALKQIVRGIINEIKALASTSFDAAVELQVLTVRLDNLIAMQVRDAMKITDYGKSIQIASGYTRGLLEWIQKLALATPVSLEDISNMTYLGLAMGWSVTAAKTLTKAIVDYTAAIGMGSEISERIIYNFAQMKQQGKVTGTELRDLGRGAFMPINEILKQMYYNIYNVDGSLEDATVSFQEFKDMASAGTAPVDEFFKAFEDFVATNMPDMAYKMNYTFRAVLQNVQDLFKILVGWNVLGPMIASITKPIQDFVNSFKSAIMLAKANAIGKSMAFMVDSIRQGFSYISIAVQNVVASLHLPAMSIENIVTTIIKFSLALREVGVMIMNLINKYILPITTKIGDKFSSDFSKMSNDFFSWGANLIFNFAQGMMKAAVSVLTQAMNFIAGILTGWLVGHSPPKIAPDIDKWGMETMNEWLHGFTQADFDMLGDMQGVIKDALGALVNLGMMTDVQASEEYLGISLDLIKAMDELNRTGTISASIFERLASIGGVFGQEISELLQLQLEYADATKIAEQAQIDYDNAIKATQASTKKVNGLIKDYNKLLRGGASKGVLSDKLKLINLAAVELAANQKAEAEKKTALEVAQENLKALQDSIELQKSLIKAMVDLAQAQKDASTAAGGGADAIKDLTDAVEDLGNAFGTAGKGIKIDWDKLRRDAETSFNLMMIDLKGKWADMWKANVSDPNSPFKIALGTMTAAWDTFAEAINLPSWEEIMKAWNEEPPIMNPPKPGEPQVPDAGIPQESTLVQRFQAVLREFAEDIKTNGGIMATLGTIATNLFNNLRDAIVLKFNELNTPENQAKVMLAINDFMTWLTDMVLGAEGVDRVGKEGQTQAATPWATRVGEALFSSLKTAVESIDWKSIGTSIMDKAQQGAIDWVNTKVEEILGPWRVYFNIVKTFWGIVGDVSSKMYELGGILMDNMNDGLVDWITSGWSKVEDGFNTFMDKMTAFWFGGTEGKVASKDGEGKMYKLGAGIIDNFIAGLESMKNTVWAKITEVFGPLADLVKLIFGEGSPSTIFFDIAVNIAQGFINGMDGMKDKVAEKTAEMFKKIPKDTKIRYEVESPSKLFERIGASAFPAISVNAPMMSSPVASNRSANFGDVNINSGLDLATFKALVQRIMIED